MSERVTLYKSSRKQGRSVYKSAIGVGVSHAKAFKAHRKIDAKLSMEEILFKYGLDDETLVKIIVEGAKSTDMDGTPSLKAKNFVELALRLSGKMKDKDGNDSEQMKTMINIINYEQTKNSNDTSGRISAEPVRIRDFSKSSEI